MIRRILPIALLLAVLGCVGWLVLASPREPVYQGKPLTYWLARYFPPATSMPSSGGIGLPDPQAVEAIRHIGTNAIPTLLRLTRAHDSPLKRRLIALGRKQHLIPIRSVAAWEQNRWAQTGFSVLGRTASDAVPALTRIFEASFSYSSREAAASALGSIGPAARPAVPSLARTLAGTNTLARRACVLALGRIQAEPQVAVPALMTSLNDLDPAVRQLATEALGRFGADAGPAVPPLIEVFDRDTAESSHAATTLGLIGPAARQAVPSLLRGLPNTNRDLEFRLQCILALGRIHAEPERVVPALMKSLSESLSDADVRIRAFSTGALGQYGPDAGSAVPLLTNLLQDPNPNVRLEATNALKRIDPAAVAQAGIE